MKPDGRVQAKDIPDAEILAAHERARGRHGVARWSTRWDIRDELPNWPAKVINAKLASMVRRGLLNGCTCSHNCRGDFEYPT